MDCPLMYRIVPVQNVTIFRLLAGLFIIIIR